MNVLCRTKAISADFSKSPKIYNRRKKRYDFLFDFLPTCISLNVKFSIPTKKTRKFFTFFTFLDQ